MGEMCQKIGRIVRNGDVLSHDGKFYSEELNAGDLIIFPSDLPIEQS
jgi:hypothetical protein